MWGYYNKSFGHSTKSPLVDNNDDEYSNGSAKYLFLETTEYFLKFIFLFESTNLPVNNGKNFFQMAASAGHAVAYTIGPIFNHIIDCVQLYFTNGFTNIVL